MRFKARLRVGKGPQELHGLLTHNQHLRIRALRIAKGLTIESVATHAGATRSRLSKVENFPITDEYARASTRACGSRGKARRPNVTYLLSAISVNPA